MPDHSSLDGRRVAASALRPALLGLLALVLTASPPGRAADDAPARKDLRVGNLRVGKVLFLGNSVTLHPPAPAIGWTGDWGMAASAREKDFVHRLVARITEAAGGEPEVMVKNIADFERNPTTYDLDAGLKDALAFEADVVVLAIGANVPAPTTDEARDGYRAACAALLARLKDHGHPVIFVRSEFWDTTAREDLMKQACRAAGGIFVDLGGPARDEANLARSERKIDHDGVAGHPGDRGMQVIADAIWKAMQERARRDGTPGR